MWVNLSLLFILYTTTFISANKRPEDDTGIFSSHSSHYLPIYHAFGPGDKYSLRGHIVFKTSRVTVANLKNEVRLSMEEVDKLKKLVDKDGFYLLRAPTKMTTNFNEDEILDSEDFVSTFVPACYLYGSLLTETIKVSVDNMGNVIGISILSPKHDCAVAQLKDLDNDNSVFNSSVLINQQVFINFFSVKIFLISFIEPDVF